MSSSEQIAKRVAAGPLGGIIQHRDGCPMERIETFDRTVERTVTSDVRTADGESKSITEKVSAGTATVSRCCDCGRQVVKMPNGEIRRD